MEIITDLPVKAVLEVKKLKTVEQLVDGHHYRCFYKTLIIFSKRHSPSPLIGETLIDFEML